MMKNWKSILFAVLIFAALFTMEATAQDFTLDSTQTAMVLRDSDNAHKVASAALGTVGCIMESLSGNAEWTPQVCIDRLEAILGEYGQEHLILHPMVVHLLERKATVETP